mgnify:CR=1 FL=1|tara:strand:- start:20300 stop:20557 length:258 start_codon:yes stop_codon:yes gene_type:complete
MLTLGETIDKLIIENIKLFNLREKINTENLSEKESNDAYTKMMILNENRDTISKFLDEKLEKVKNGEPNRVIKLFKTYESDRDKA